MKILNNCSESLLIRALGAKNTGKRIRRTRKEVFTFNDCYRRIEVTEHQSLQQAQWEIIFPAKFTAYIQVRLRQAKTRAKHFDQGLIFSQIYLKTSKQGEVVVFIRHLGNKAGPRPFWSPMRVHERQHQSSHNFGLQHPSLLPVLLCRPRTTSIAANYKRA